ncbi:DJ-1 family glyoxalase III [Candidatus Cardinium hertigii]|uniref:DJ-1/PfpI family protein n=1 Tax=Candidatus Cardinium hertigii TaxID=247481 RepID=A0A3N2QCU8_9BACT|nr:DJ-1 family glyoxalase III [Candidatus Cardinium hertigii]ROT47636.1 DJ-1/PfpI family protein [Candidatus Cardinium hertigii]
MKKALIIGSNGSEEIELIITSDILRCSGIDVTIAGLQDDPMIICSRKTKLQVDSLFKEIAEHLFDAVILPGGQPGSHHLSEDKRVGTLLRHHEQEGKIIAAICAAPLALASHHIAIGGKLTTHDSIRAKMESAGYLYSEEPVCVWKNIVTSRGPGTAFAFALKLVELLIHVQKSKEIGKAMLVY